MEEKSYSKPGYDARLEYYKILGKYLNTIGQCIVSEDLPTWHRSLYGTYIMVKAYINTKTASKIKYELENCESLLQVVIANSSNYQITHQLKKILFKITEDLHTEAKHVFLPVREDEVGEFSEEDFLRGSDL